MTTVATVPKSGSAEVDIVSLRRAFDPYCGQNDVATVEARHMAKERPKPW
jgi:hypothetical protein